MKQLINDSANSHYYNGQEKVLFPINAIFLSLKRYSNT